MTAWQTTALTTTAWLALNALLLALRIRRIRRTRRADGTQHHPGPGSTRQHDRTQAAGPEDGAR